MTMNVLSGSAAYVLLGGALSSSSSVATTDSGDILTAAVGIAKAQFTTPAATAPWETTQPSARADTVLKLKSLIDPPDSANKDLAATFALYKALDRLHTLAAGAAKAGLSDGSRAAMAARFTSGLAEVQGFIAGADVEKLRLGFGSPQWNLQSVALPKTAASVKGKGVADARESALTGLIGVTSLSVKLTKSGRTDTVIVPLDGGAPTLDRVAAALNSAMSSIQLTKADGTPQTTPDGLPIARYLSQFAVEKQPDGKWGLSLSGVSTETVSLDQPDAGNAVVVATGTTMLDAPGRARVLRFDVGDDKLQPHAMATINATDRDASARAKLQSTAKTAPAPVMAATRASSVVVSPDGSSFVIGTSAGDMGAHLSDGRDRLVLTKLDSEGRTLWQRTLGGTGPTDGASVALAPDGGVIVAGSTTAKLTSLDQLNGKDAFVAGFAVDGTPRFTTQLDSRAEDGATALAVGGDGSIYVGGTVSGALPGQTGAGAQDGFVTRLNADGKILARAQFGGSGKDGVAALAIGADGTVLIASNEDGQAMLRGADPATLAIGDVVSLGAGRAASIAVDAASGAIAIGGSSAGDGTVTQLDAQLSVLNKSLLASAKDDRVDSLTWLDGELFAAGRSSGDLGGNAIGATDGFVARIGSDGAVGDIQRFGTIGGRTEPVTVAAAPKGAAVLGAIGLHRGALNAPESMALTAQTNVRTGDSFRLRVGTGALRTVTIAENETMASLAKKVSLLLGTAGKATALSLSAGTTLKIEASKTARIEVRAGPDGQDALSKLGLAPAQLEQPKISAGGKTPIVTPGGTFSLDLDRALSLGKVSDATFAQTRIEAAMSTIQSAARSLYWSDTKAQIVNDAALHRSGSAPPGASAKLKNYQQALARLTAMNTGTSL